MKRFVLLFMSMAVMFTAAYSQAAITGTLKSTFGNTVDTVSNTGSLTKYMYTSRIAGTDIVGVSVYLTEISGTTAGTITIEASMDNSKWYNAYYANDTSYTFTATDVAAQNFRFKVHNFTDNYLRVKYVGTGTMSDKIEGFFSAKKLH